jgi:flagellar biosynthesis chaperone FliJ
MAKKPIYPLEQLAEIKKRRVEEAEKDLKRKKDLLEAEIEKLRKREEERDQVKAHKGEKIQQLNEKFDVGITSDEIEQSKVYLKVVDEKLKAKEIKVEEQEVVVKAAEKAVEEARALLIKRQTEVEKIHMHRKEWEKEMKILEAQADEKLMDELGSISFVRKKNEPK